MKLPRIKHQSDVPRRRSAANDTKLATPAERTVNNFRRGRTLTGSRSSTISSSNELNADLLSPRAHVHHLTKRRRHLFGKFVLVGIATLALYILLSQMVADVSVVANSKLNVSSTQRQALEKRIDEYYAGHLFERFLPSLNQKSLTAFMQEKHPEVAVVKVEATGQFGKGSARVGLRKPVARWVINGDTQYVDSNGVVFSHSAYPTPKLTIVDKNSVGSASGQLVASHRFLAFVGQVVGDAKNRNLTVTHTTIPFLTSRQLDVKFKGVKPRFKLAVDRSAGEQVEDISRIVRYFNQRGGSPGYVDVRVKGKAFYK